MSLPYQQDAFIALPCRFRLVSVAKIYWSEGELQADTQKSCVLWADDIGVQMSRVSIIQISWEIDLVLTGYFVYTIARGFVYDNQALAAFDNAFEVARI